MRPKYSGTPGTGWETLIQYGNTIIKDKVMYASKWPLLELKQSVDEMRELPLKPEVKEMWLSGNAKRLLKL